MLDKLDQTILTVAYEQIERSGSKIVAGSTVWEEARKLWPDLAPVTVPARLKRLVSQGLLTKDLARSSSRTKVYGPTDAGYKAWREGR
jgi:hypothetical protein